MVKRVTQEDSLCGIARPMDAIGDGWSLLIVRDAFDGLRRFGEFQKSLCWSKNILAARLRHFGAHGVGGALPAPPSSPYQEYLLTEKGRGLFPVLVALRQWGESFFFARGEPHVRQVDRLTGRRLQRMVPLAQDGRALRPEDVEVRMPGRK